MAGRAQQDDQTVGESACFRWALKRWCSFGLRLMLFAVWLAAVGCTRSTQPQPSRSANDVSATAVQRVLEQDAELGRRRNHAPESNSLSDAIEDYVDGLDALDFADCPEPFVAAFRRHRDAWHMSIPFFEAYPDLRGEMHDVFDQLRANDAARSALERIESRIWETWAEVEAATPPAE